MRLHAPSRGTTAAAPRSSPTSGSTPSFKWSTTGASSAVDVQTIAAHELGHVLQFDHVTNASKDDDTTLMWLYFSAGDTSGRKLGRGDALADNSHY